MTKLTSNGRDKGEKRGQMRKCQDPNKGKQVMSKQIRMEQGTQEKDPYPGDQKGLNLARKR